MGIKISHQQIFKLFINGYQKFALLDIKMIYSNSDGNILLPINTSPNMYLNTKQDGQKPGTAAPYFYQYSAQQQQKCCTTFYCRWLDGMAE